MRFRVFFVYFFGSFRSSSMSVALIKERCASGTYRYTERRIVTGGGGPVRKTAIGSRRRPPHPKHLDISKGAPLRLPKPLSDQFPVRVCARALFVHEPSVNGVRA